MKDLCILEVSPSGPTENHEINFKNFDYFYVTHDEEVINDSRCISFNKGCRWNVNRNCLYNYVKKLETEYKYYMFIDYDVEIKSENNNEPIIQLIKDLNEYNPAVMVINDKTKSDYSFIKNNSISNLMFSNNQVKIYHYSILDYIFEIPTNCLGLWDACHHNNILEIPFYKYVLCDSKISCRGLVSCLQSQPSFHTNKDVMTEMHNYIYPFLKEELKKFKKHKDIKNEYLNLSKKLTPIKMPDDVNYLKLINVFDFFDEKYPHFENLYKYYNSKKNITN
tara:strand:+ start:1436 stop:2272 length:837 start_codon:yes stop_codon:yes gene_type:complete